MGYVVNGSISHNETLGCLSPAMDSSQPTYIATSDILVQVYIYNENLQLVIAIHLELEDWEILGIDNTCKETVNIGMIIFQLAMRKNRRLEIRNTSKKNQQSN